MRALVIDDSRMMRRMLSKILMRLGFEAVQASDGAEGLEKMADRGPFDLALVDWNMPRMSGFEFVEAVRAEQAHAHVRLVMITTETEIAAVSDALQAGADEYIFKPFTPDMLLSKLALLGIETTEVA